MEVVALHRQDYLSPGAVVRIVVVTADCSRSWALHKPVDHGRNAAAKPRVE